MADGQELSASRAIEFALNCLTNNGRYHNHKETMAHAALLLQVAFFGFIMSREQWPFCWIPNLTIKLNREVLASIGVFVIWVGIHVYLRWQLRRRRSAAFFDSAVRITVTKWLIETPKPETLKPRERGIKNVSNFWTFLDYIFPCGKASVVYGPEKEVYPGPIFAEWERQSKTKTGAILAERIIWVGEVLMLITILLRTCI